MQKSRPGIDVLLEELAAKSVRQKENVRERVRDLTLQGLQARELSLSGIKQVVRSVASGVSLGAASGRLDVEKTLSDALAGMDDAVLKAVEASRVALDRLSHEGADFESSRLRKSLSDLERMEDELLKTIGQVSARANATVREQWQAILQRVGVGGTLAGQQANQLLVDIGARVQAQLRTNRATTLKAAHLLAQNFGTLASGILIGLAEGLHGAGNRPSAAKATTAKATTAKATTAKATAAKATKPATQRKSPLGQAPTRKPVRSAARPTVQKAAAGRAPRRKPATD